MTESTFTSPRLERPARAPLAGVSLALARTTGTDVVLWRVLFVVLTLFGGLGAALYLACWVAIPAEGADMSLAERLVRGPDRHLSTRQLLLLAVLVVAVVGVLHRADGGWVVLVVAAAAAYGLWQRHSSGATPVVTTGPTVATPPATSPTDAGVPVAAPPPAPRARSVVTGLTLSTASLVVGALLLLAAGGALSVPAEVLLAVALLVVGAGLVASAWLGRARGLVPVAVLLVLALGGTAAARPLVDHGVGSRAWTATSSGTFRLGAGQADLTLAPLPGDTVQHVSAEVVFGRLFVHVPNGVNAVVDARVTNGEVRSDGVAESGRRVHRSLVYGDPSAPQVVVDAEVTMGQVEVRRG